MKKPGLEVARDRDEKSRSAHHVHARGSSPASEESSVAQQCVRSLAVLVGFAKFQHLFRKVKHRLGINLNHCSNALEKWAYGSTGRIASKCNFFREDTGPR